MRLRGKGCIALKLREAKIEGCKTPRGKEQSLNNSAGQLCLQSLLSGVMEPLIFAPWSFEPLNPCPAGSWSNATFALQTHGEIVSGAKIQAQFLQTNNAFSDMT